MDEDDDLYAKLYGEAAPARPAPEPEVKELAAEIQPETQITDYGPPPGEPKSALSTQPSSSNAFDFDRGTEQGVSTFDDDEDDLEIRLDKIEAPNPEEEDDLDIKLDSKQEAGPSAHPPTPPGISAVHKYVRGAAPQATAKNSGSLPPQPQLKASEDGSQPAPPAAAPPGLQPLKRPPSYPTYDPKDPGVLPSQATTKGQRVRLPGQTRVTPEEYKEFLCLGHGDIFQLDIDCVIDAPWYQPGADPADFFNYGLNPRTWKEYCAQIQKFQTEFTMQRQIEVYDKDGRARGGNSDLPPELAAAVAQKRAAEGPNKPYQDRTGNGHQGGRGPASGQRALPYSKWHGHEGSREGGGARPMSDNRLPLPPFGALEWNNSDNNQGSQLGDAQLLDSKRRRLDTG